MGPGVGVPEQAYSQPVPIRVGIVGANPERGWARQAHIPALLALPEFQIHAVCTRNEESSRAAARAFGASLSFVDARALARHPEVDLVVVAVKVPDHRQPVLDALEAGKHVYCEWPLGASGAQTEEMSAAAHRAGTRTVIGLQSHGSPALRRARDLVNSGYVGRILSASVQGSVSVRGGATLPSELAWAADRANGASILTIPAGHAMDALFFCVGEPRDVWASVATQTTSAHVAETEATVEVTAPDQVVAGGALAAGGAFSIHVQGGAVSNGFRMEIHGDQGMLLLSTHMQSVQLADLVLEGARAGEDLQVIDVSEERSALPEGLPGNVAALYSGLARAILDGGPSAPDFDHAALRHRFLDAIVEASERGVRLYGAEGRWAGAGP